MTALRNFEPTVRWVDENGMLTERAKGYLRGLFDFIGATTGTIPSGSLGTGTSSQFYRGDGVFAVPAYPTAANPTASVGSTGNNGVAATFMRSDAAPALNLTIPYTFTNTLQAAGITSSTSITATTGFGCNGKTAQTAASVGAAVAGTAATNAAPYGYATAAQADDIVSRINTIRSALIANGILV